VGRDRLGGQAAVRRKGVTAAFAFIATERPKRTLRLRREQRRAVRPPGENTAGYFLFALREVRRAAFFAAILRTVGLFFLLLAVIGMKGLPLTVSGGTIRTPENLQNMSLLD